MHQLSKQLVEILKPMDHNEIWVAQQQKEASLVKDHLASAIYADMLGAANEIVPYAEGIIKTYNMAK